MMRLLQLAILLLLSLAILHAEAAVPVRIDASYDVLKGSMKIATISETFIRNKDRYKIESVSDAVGMLAYFKPETIRLSSEGEVTRSGLRPDIFSSRRKLDYERNTGASFDWANDRITLTDRNGKRALPLPSDTQDRLSAMYQFLYLPLQNMTRLDFHMTNGSKVDIYNYFISSGGSITVPLGTYQAIYVSSVPDPKASRTEIWLATEYGGFPCKMTITDQDGGELNQVLTRFISSSDQR